jgi:hypothetical protein
MRFNWGDNAAIASDAPADARPGAEVSVCGMRTIETAQQAAAAGHPVGTILYVVEFGDGSALEVPEAWLR